MAGAEDDDDDELSTDSDLGRRVEALAGEGFDPVRGVFGGAFRALELGTAGRLGGDLLSAAVTDAAVTGLVAGGFEEKLSFGDRRAAMLAVAVFWGGCDALAFADDDDRAAAGGDFLAAPTPAAWAANATDDGCMPWGGIGYDCCDDPPLPSMNCGRRPRPAAGKLAGGATCGR